ncbi:MAG TPA: DUF4280 domain-containing protein [Ilumatobacteraceae bacterium]|nr:DUF4280 domain-containing protein [Ilumatobacteraceae bacterium]
MAQPVVMGDNLMCTMGVAPAPIVVPPVNRVLAENKPMANIMDFKPFVNIMPFGVCLSLGNPATAALTSAALGVLTPGPCTPAPAAPWAPGSPTVLVANVPALNSTSKCICSFGGQISVAVPTAFKETLP